jgi:peptidoglycan/LPS O-acetylase OafA/YrhL
MKRTIGNELDKHDGVGPGFDYVRLGLAVLIFYGHARWIASSTENAMFGLDAVGPQDGDAHWLGWKRPRNIVLVPMFFALSGFLVTGSALRTGTLGCF